ncbi:hypothetical protein EW145_g626 [Phellinidium pouzarii]|uniref:Uncharacterized protein n=1 Tax=Phellinidium pouzarii TaxID=167371 RepID=A0A4S4LI86_9AGAM|nr:hypothetical protein EW145_g626 [Phellinidium pouzarii]
MASFSRLQLAAALLEYDNDPDNPKAPRRSAHDSAIFSRLRSVNGNIHATKEADRNADYLAVAKPSDTGPPTETDKELTRRSKVSMDMLHNPFGGEEEEEPEEDLEVDLASWGLDSLISDKKATKISKNNKGKAKSDVLPNTRRLSTSGFGSRLDNGHVAHSRSISMSLAEFGEGGKLLDPTSDGRRNTISGPLDISEGNVLDRPGERRRASSYSLTEDLSIRPPTNSLSSYEKKRDTIPFPSSSPILERNEADRLSSSRPPSHLVNLSGGHELGQSDEPNPFAIPPPPLSRASRFDPKSIAHARTLSNATRLSVVPKSTYNEENDNLVLRAPSRVDVKSARDKRLSVASFGTREMLDDEYQSHYGEDEYRERRYSRLDLMRPKVLVMPSPLQCVSAVPVHNKPTRDGFLDSTDGRPMPPGARTPRMSMLGLPTSLNVPVASNSFTPNPRLSLSASQLLFRNSLLVDGQRDVTYNDIDGSLQRAVEDGEQAKLDFPEVKEEKATSIALSPTEETKTSRPPGKLFGRSLIDDLETRKAEMRSKQRVFTGDKRPSMMDRNGIKRSSTFIDPDSLQLKTVPGIQIEPSATDTTLTRRGSRNSQPLLAIDGTGQIAETGVREPKLMQTRSVFGVDTIWEREMAKLKEIEAQERAEAQERKKLENEEETKKTKRKKKGKGPEVQLNKNFQISPSPTSPAAAFSPEHEHTPSLSLPDIPLVTSRKRSVPIPADDDSDYESSASEAALGRAAPLFEEAVDQWVSDDEKRPVQASRIGLGYSLNHLTPENDSDEDLPLSMALQRASHKLSIPMTESDNSDEDKPLSSLLDKPKLNIPSIDLDQLTSPHSGLHLNITDNDDEDDVPLGIRASCLPAGASHLSGIFGLSAGGNGDDDDRPLSMHPGQIRKSQFQMFAQTQQQQQLFQAQMVNSMAFAPPPSMLLMTPPSVPFAPQPPIQMQEPNKFNSVDRWRHGVAVEGPS